MTRFRISSLIVIIIVCIISIIVSIIVGISVGSISVGGHFFVFGQFFNIDCDLSIHMDIGVYGDIILGGIIGGIIYIKCTFIINFICLLFLVFNNGGGVGGNL